MLWGQAVVAIWNGITPDGRAEFYAWHLQEHMPERAAIPGFRRGRRYIAADAATHPEFFTLYEAATMAVLLGPDYAARLDAPTPWTRRATAAFRDTSRAMAGVRHSEGPGAGAAILTIRFETAAGAGSGDAALIALLHETLAAPRVTGAHLCAADLAASGQRTTETRGRADIQAPPAWFLMVEATDPEALATLLPDPTLRAAGAAGTLLRGRYRLEYTRTDAG